MQINSLQVVSEFLGISWDASSIDVHSANIIRLSARAPTHMWAFLIPNLEFDFEWFISLVWLHV